MTYNVRYMYYSYRHHGLIPWDDDVDLVVSDADREKVVSALVALRPDYDLFSHCGTFDRTRCRAHWKFFPLRLGGQVLIIGL